MANIEDIWKTLEVPKGRGNPLDYLDTSFSPTEENASHPFEDSYEDDTSYDDPFANGSGEFVVDEVEILNRNGRLTREFSLSHYDVDIRPFQQYRSKFQTNRSNSSPEGHSSRSNDSIEEVDEEEYSREIIGDDLLNHSEELTQDHHPLYDGMGSLHLRGEGYSNEGTGSGHVICDCEDCINQTEDVECHCENCVHQREDTPVSPHTPPPREVTCDCEDCLNHSGDTFTCECENCQDGTLGNDLSEGQNNNNNNHPEDVCKCPECVGQFEQMDHHDDDPVCFCENCVQERGEQICIHEDGG